MREILSKSSRLPNDRSLLGHSRLPTPRPPAKKSGTTYDLWADLLDRMNVLVWIGDKDDRCIYVNQRCCELVGYEKEEFLGRKASDFWQKEFITSLEQANSVRRKGFSSSYEGTLLAKDGTQIPVFISGSPLPDGGSIAMVADLRELKQREAREKVLTSAIRFANDAIVILNPQGKIESWNKGAKIMFGYKDEEILGESLARIFSSEDIDEMQVPSQTQSNFELKAKHKNGQIVVVSATHTPVFNKDRKVSYWLLIARDITTDTKYEEELALKYQKLRDAYNQFGIVRRQMDYVFELSELAEGRHNIKLLADFVVNSVIMLTRVDACVLRVYNQKKNTLDLLSCFGLTEDWKGKAALKYRGSLVEEAFKLRRGPLKIIDLSKEPKYHTAYLAKKNNLSSMLVIPLVFGSELVGSLSLYASPQKKLEIFENEFIEKYARLIAMSIAKSQ